jgi:predicted  nucleic acid-binding Zn-ribbon protein
VTNAAEYQQNMETMVRQEAVVQANATTNRIATEYERKIGEANQKIANLERKLVYATKAVKESQIYLQNLDKVVGLSPAVEDNRVHIQRYLADRAKLLSYLSGVVRELEVP